MVIMTHDSRFHSIGINDRGQLGIGNTFEKTDWCEIESLAEREIKTICCGSNHVRFYIIIDHRIVRYTQTDDQHESGRDI